MRHGSGSSLPIYATPAPGLSLERLAVAIARCSEQLREDLAAVGTTPEELALLRAAAARSPAPWPDVMGELVLSEHAAARTLDGLVEKGWICVTTSRRARRVQLEVALSREGRRALAKARARLHVRERALDHVADARELAALGARLLQLAGPAPAGDG